MKQAKLLTDAEFKRLTAVINSLRYQSRNHTIIALSFYAGLRACEIAALRIGDVFDPEGNVKDTIYLSSSQTKGSDSCHCFGEFQVAKTIKQVRCAVSPTRY